MKKFFVVIFAGLLTSTAFAQTEADFDVVLTADGSGVVIMKYTGAAIQVEIPAMIQGMPVREIGTGRNVFRNQIVSVVIPEGVTKIGGLAFNRCKSLSSVAIPDTVTEIGNRAFEGCGFTSVRLPAGLVQAGHGLFDYCVTLSAVIIPEGVKVISENMFRGCKALAAINIPESVISIGESAFYETGLTTFNWPAAVTVIPRSAFGKSAITSIVIPEGVTEIGALAFSNCKALTSVTFPSTIVTIQSPPSFRVFLAATY